MGAVSTEHCGLGRSLLSAEAQREKGRVPEVSSGPRAGRGGLWVRESGWGLKGSRMRERRDRRRPCVQPGSWLGRVS